jgi:hypothetical protein
MTGSKPEFKQISLRDVIAANPGISVPEAVMRLNAYNTAVARGEPPPPITAPTPGPTHIPAVAAAPIPTTPFITHSHIPTTIPPNGLGLTMGIGAIGDAATKPHREL